MTGDLACGVGVGGVIVIVISSLTCHTSPSSGFGLGQLTLRLWRRGGRGVVILEEGEDTRDGCERRIRGAGLPCNLGDAPSRMPKPEILVRS